LPPSISLPNGRGLDRENQSTREAWLGFEVQALCKRDVIGSVFRAAETCAGGGSVLENS
jgi:hypothetical protein